MSAMRFAIEINSIRYGTVIETGGWEAETIAKELGALVERTYLYHYDGQGSIMKMEDAE